jgi:hypothetical protein
MGLNLSKIILAGFLFSHPLVSNAESTEPTETKEVETLLKTNTAGLPAHGGVAVKITEFGQTTALLMGGWGGLALNRSWGLAVGGYSLASEATIKKGDISSDLTFSYFGLRIEKFLGADNIFFVSPSLLIGPGYAMASPLDPNLQKERDLFMVIEPEINLWWNITMELRIFISAGLRIVSGSDLSAFQDQDLSRFNTTLGFIWGKI